jgi:hypothetical protein
MEVLGANHIANFDPAERMYYAWLPLGTDMALVRAYSNDPASQMTYDLRVDGVAIEYGSFPTGGGEIMLALIPDGPSFLYVTVTAPGRARASYGIDIQAGCSNCDDGNACTADTCDAVEQVCTHDWIPGGQCSFPCTEQGIRDAILVGGGPHTFECRRSTTVVTTDTIFVDNDVILDGEGNLTVDAANAVTAFRVDEGVTAELHGFVVKNGQGYNSCGSRFCIWEGGGFLNDGTLTLINSVVADNELVGILNLDYATLTLMNTTVSGTMVAETLNQAMGIINLGTMTLTNSTVSENVDGGIVNEQVGTMTLTNSTVSGNGLSGIYNGGTMTLTNSLVDGDCGGVGFLASNGYNIESPGNTCGFDQPTDQAEVPATALNLGPLQDNGGPTETHALLPSSVAIDWIPEVDCVDADGAPLTTDQRGVARPQGVACDVGAFELEQ